MSNPYGYKTLQMVNLIDLCNLSRRVIKRKERNHLTKVTKKINKKRTITFQVAESEDGSEKADGQRQHNYRYGKGTLNPINYIYRYCYTHTLI